MEQKAFEAKTLRFLRAPNPFAAPPQERRRIAEERRLAEEEMKRKAEEERQKAEEERRKAEEEPLAFTSDFCRAS